MFISGMFDVRIEKLYYSTGKYEGCIHCAAEEEFFPMPTLNVKPAHLWPRNQFCDFLLVFIHFCGF